MENLELGKRLALNGGEPQLYVGWNVQLTARMDVLRG